MSSPFFAPTSFSSGGVTIRAYQPGDGPALREATVSSYDHLRPWMPWATTTDGYSPEAAEANCRRFYANYLLNEDFTLGIWVGGELAGGSGFHLRYGPIGSGNAEIGMWIRASYAGTGLGTRALGMLLEWGFTEWRWERLIWRCDTRNIASARVAQKNGLTLEGTHRADMLDVHGQRRDTHMFAILRRDWHARQGGQE